jgi:Uma2 family endonuclease
MNILHHEPPATTREPRQRFVLGGVTWQGYDLMLQVIGNRRIRCTYDRGSLELMSPLPLHEYFKHWFCQLFGVLAMELDVPLWACGSTTFRRQDLDRGLEPDECYYLANLARLHDRMAIDLTVDPPPDLAVEIDVTRSCLDRLGIYAALGVPEVWRFDGEILEVHQRTAAGTYEVAARSAALPFLPLPELLPVIEQGMNAPHEGALMRLIRAWVRTRLLPLYQAAGGSSAPETN